MASKFFEKLVPQLIQEDERLVDTTPNISVEEKLVLTDTRTDTESIMQVSFKFSKPVPAGKALQGQALDSLADLVQTGSLEVAERILAHMGLSQQRPQKTATKTTKIQLDKPGRYRKPEKVDKKQRFTDGKGRFISELNLRNAIQLASTAELVSNMKKNKANASKGTGLKFQTGRFALSMKLKPLTLKQNNTLSIFYTYMVNPYSVFDPTVSNYRGLSNAKRNPRYMISTAISEALKKLGLSRYNIEIKQHRR